jgi:hypothetical protein
MTQLVTFASEKPTPEAARPQALDSGRSFFRDTIEP